MKAIPKTRASSTMGAARVDGLQGRKGLDDFLADGGTDLPNLRGTGGGVTATGLD